VIWAAGAMAVVLLASLWNGFVGFIPSPFQRAPGVGVAVSAVGWPVWIIWVLVAG
jgi:hypothetical protein